VHVLIDQPSQLIVVKGREVGQNVHAVSNRGEVANSVPVLEVFLKY
jgi:hypothetical protein